MLIGKENYKVGMTVYGVPYGNYARYNQDVVEFEIVKVSKKYAELQRKGWRTTEKCTMTEGKIEGFNSGYCIHSSLQEIKDKKERSLLIKKFTNYFSLSNKVSLTLEQLKKIDEILNEN